MCMVPLHVVNLMPPLDQTVSYFTCYRYIFIKTEPLNKARSDTRLLSRCSFIQCWWWNKL